MHMTGGRDGVGWQSDGVEHGRSLSHAPYITFTRQKKKWRKKMARQDGKKSQSGNEKPDADSQRRVWVSKEQPNSYHINRNMQHYKPISPLFFFFMRLLRERFTFNCERQSRCINPIILSLTLQLKALKGLKSARLHKPLSLAKKEKIV